MIRKVPLVTGEYYHVLNKSVGGAAVFRNQREYAQMLSLIKYYQYQSATISYSQMVYLRKFDKILDNKWARDVLKDDGKWVNIIAYCLMPTHIHFLIQQKEDGGIKEFMRRIQSSYACYFNRRNKRKGPLWIGRFKGILIKDDSQLLHVTRYIHLNPTTAGLVENPEDWKYSSYQMYINRRLDGNHFIQVETTLDPIEYKNFVMKRRDYQKEIGLMKSLSQADELE